MTAAAGDPERAGPVEPPPSAEVQGAALVAWQAGGAEFDLPIRGVSMWPALREGDQARVTAGQRRYRPGEIVVFRSGVGLIAHRLLQVKVHQASRQYFTQGDCCPLPDPPVEAGALLGRIIGVRRGGQFYDLSRRHRVFVGWLRAVAMRSRNAVRAWRGRAG